MDNWICVFYHFCLLSVWPDNMLLEASKPCNRYTKFRTRDPPLGPPFDTSRNFPAHVSAESPSNISPNPLEVLKSLKPQKK